MSFSKKNIIALIILLGSVGWLVFFNFKNDSPMTSEDDNIAVSYPSEPTIIFPAVESKKVFDVPIEKASREIKSLILPDAVDVSIQRVAYSQMTGASRTSGFEIAYTISGTNHTLTELYNSQLSLAEKPDWQVLAAKLEESQAFIEFDHNVLKTNYKLRFSISNGDDFDVKVLYLITIP